MTATSFTSATTVRPATSGVLAKFVRSSVTWLRAVVAEWDRRAAMKALHQLDDRALRDIGISRSEIERAVHGRNLPDISRF
jgi:uncharacterized protein YjiS (DUF1127 family)